jgi:hypothetical protein
MGYKRLNFPASHYSLLETRFRKQPVTTTALKALNYPPKILEDRQIYTCGPHFGHGGKAIH